MGEEQPQQRRQQLEGGCAALPSWRQNGVSSKRATTAQGRLSRGYGAGLSATLPQDLSRYLDFQGAGLARTGAETMSSIALRRSSGGGGTCNPSISWDGLSVDPRPFARFDENQTVTTGAKPAGCGGKRVVLLEGHATGGIFGQPATESGQIPFTIEQETSGALSPATDPMEAIQGQETGMIVNYPYFNSSKVVAPKIVTMPIPVCYREAGPDADGCLLLPKERRAINEYDARQQRAQSLHRKARQQKIRLQYLAANRHREGITAVDSTENPNSEVYAEKGVRVRQGEARQRYLQDERRKRLNSLIGNAKERFGFEPLHHNEEWLSQQQLSSSSTGVRPFLQGKGPGGHMSTAGAAPGLRGRAAEAATHHRLFHKDEVSEKPKRTAHLRYQDCGGKRHDIISGVPFAHNAESAVAAARYGWEERVNKRLAHPSQSSLERGRNTQGAPVHFK